MMMMMMMMSWCNDDDGDGHGDLTMLHQRKKSLQRDCKLLSAPSQDAKLLSAPSCACTHTHSQ